MRNNLINLFKFNLPFKTWINSLASLLPINIWMAGIPSLASIKEISKRNWIGLNYFEVHLPTPAVTWTNMLAKELVSVLIGSAIILS